MNVFPEDNPSLCNVLSDVRNFAYLRTYDDGNCPHHEDCIGSDFTTSQCYVRGPPPLPSLHTMGSGCGDLPGPMAALADFDDHDLEEVCLPDSKHIHTADA